MNTKFSTSLLLGLILTMARMAAVESILPTAGLDIHVANGNTYSLLASQASFGKLSEMTASENTPYQLEHSPSDNWLMCVNATQSDQFKEKILLIPRGDCSFQHKTMNAQRMGAAGVIVYGTLGSRYSMNTTSGEQIYPSKGYDYDCQKGEAEIPKSALNFPYDASKNDALLGGANEQQNLCLKNSKDQLSKCASKACLLTNGNTTSEDTVQACCAWDLHVWLYNDPIFGPQNVTIPAVYVTMEEAAQLQNDMAHNSPVMATMYSRWRGDYNWSSILIWALGVLVAAFAAWASAGEYRDLAQHLIQRRATRTVPQASAGVIVKEGEETTAVTATNASAAPMEESLELSAEHAFGFIIMASSGLFILFFFKIYNIVKIMYGFGCSRAVAQVIFEPIYHRIFRLCRIPNTVVTHIKWEDIGNVTMVDLIAGISGYALGFSWLYVAFTVRHPESNTFFWVTQDIMGASMCVLFLGLIRLNSMRVASILLMVAFFYDIFFVFVTPLLFQGKSVMITVATSGGPPKADPSWCEKYPDDGDCQGGDPLPMLLTMPRINDYQGGASLLGLGDIVLPGLLLSFAARLDAAKQVLGVLGGGDASRFCRVAQNGGSYFWPMVVAYAIGLFMANAAVYLMNMGQPALLYLVPMCLGCMCYLGWRRNELPGLWEGPKCVRTVDAILYGEYQPGGQQDGAASQVLPTEEGVGVAPSVPSAVDDDALGTGGAMNKA